MVREVIVGLINESITNSPLQVRFDSDSGGVRFPSGVVVGQAGVVLLQLKVGLVPQLLSVIVFPLSSTMLQVPLTSQDTEPRSFVSVLLANRRQFWLGLFWLGLHDPLQTGALFRLSVVLHTEVKESSGGAQLLAILVL
jgi:hypothetical protein